MQICRRNCLSRATLCDQGDHSVHNKCDKLSQQQISDLENGEGSYTCKSCSSLRDDLSPAVGPSPVVVSNPVGAVAMIRGPDTHATNVIVRSPEAVGAITGDSQNYYIKHCFKPYLCRQRHHQEPREHVVHMGQGTETERQTTEQ